MNTTAKRALSVSSNKSARHFTLKFTYDDSSVVKYRTNAMTKEAFSECENNTDNDWEEFLKSSGDYYKI